MYSDSAMNKLSPIFKVISLLLIIIMSILSSSLADYILLVALFVIVLLYSGIEIRNFIQMLLGFKLLFLISIIFSIFVHFDFFIKIFVVLGYLLIISYTTSSVSFIYGFEKVLTILNKKTEIGKITFRLMLIMKFPLLYALENEKIINTQKNVFQKIHQYFLNMRMGIKNSVSKCRRIGYNYNVRLYDYFYTRTYYSIIRWNLVATILIVLYLIILYLIIK